MKKSLLITFVLLIAGSLQLFPAKPIPSFDVKMTVRANFQEKHIGQTGKEKRQMNIETSTATPVWGTNENPPGGDAIVYLYKLNGSKVLGPFEISNDDVLTVPIDNSEWGVVIEMTKPGPSVLASVWTSEDSPSAANLQPGSWFPQGQSYYTLLAQR